MQYWFVESEFLGILRVTFDETAFGLNGKMNSRLGAIVQIDLMHSGKPTKNVSKESQVFIHQLREYEAGDFQALDKSYVAITGTEYQKTVLKEMRGIDSGTVVTYGDLAKLSGRPRAARAVASLCATNKVPLILPCHRVVPSDLSIGNYAIRKMKNGSKIKEKLLQHENALI